MGYIFIKIKTEKVKYYIIKTITFLRKGKTLDGPTLTRLYIVEKKVMLILADYI